MQMTLPSRLRRPRALLLGAAALACAAVAFGAWRGRRPAWAAMPDSWPG